MKNLILLTNNLVEVPLVKANASTKQALGTVVANLLYFGYAPSKALYAQLTSIGDSNLTNWWSELQDTFKEITGENKKMAKYVVYKNFPQEVLEMSQAEYWIKQILMYWGFDKEHFVQEEEKRDPLFEKVQLKSLQSATSDSLEKIYVTLLQAPARWTAVQEKFAMYLCPSFTTDTAKITFKENLVKVAAYLIENKLPIKMRSAMDVLRLATQLSGGDVSFRTNSEFRGWKRRERRYFLNLLNNSSNLEDDVARRREVWKKFLHNLHPFDYPQFKNVKAVNDKLYNDNVTSFNGRIETLLENNDTEVLELLESRPGEFVRRLHKMVLAFKTKAIGSFVSVLPSLTTLQLLKINKYLETIGERSQLTIAPKGNWTKLKILENKKEKISTRSKNLLCGAINEELESRLKNVKVDLHDSAQFINIQTNDSDLLPYGRGTVFPIPENITFLRTASYWQVGSAQTIWFDNGWNFFDENWGSLETCCWNYTLNNYGAVFSGDPVSGGEMKGRACQMIDLDINKLAERGIRYGVWNILCYSNVAFNKVDEVYAALQWGEKAQEGKLFEPSRCQISFPIKGDNYTKYVAVLDTEKRQLIYIDANLKGHVSSAGTNAMSLSKVMPAFMEYVGTIPSMYDLFVNAKQSKKGMFVGYSDEGVKIHTEEAFVLRPTNQENKYTQLNVNKLLSEKGKKEKSKGA